MPPAITNCQASESPPQTRTSCRRYLPNIGTVHPPVRESIGKGRQLRHRPWSVPMGKVNNGRLPVRSRGRGGCSPSERQKPASLLLTGENAGRLPPECRSSLATPTQPPIGPEVHSKRYMPPRGISRHIAAALAFPGPSIGRYRYEYPAVSLSVGMARKSGERRRGFAPKRSQGQGLDGSNARRLYDGRYLAVIGNAVWTSAQENIKETNGCRFLSSRHCGMLSGGPFGRTPSRKRSGRGTPSFSSRTRSRKPAGSRGPERSGAGGRMIRLGAGLKSQPVVESKR